MEISRHQVQNASRTHPSLKTTYLSVLNKLSPLSSFTGTKLLNSSPRDLKFVLISQIKVNA